MTSKVILIVDLDCKEICAIPMTNEETIICYKDIGVESNDEVKFKKSYSKFYCFSYDHELEDGDYDYYSEVQIPLDGDWHELDDESDVMPDASWFDRFDEIIAIDYKDFYKTRIRLASSCTSS